MAQDEAIGTEPAGGAGIRVAVGIVLKRIRLVLAVGLLAGVGTHLALTHTTGSRFVVSFDARYKSGTGVLAGLGNLVGNLPSLLEKDTIETQFEIIRSHKVLRGALERVGEPVEGLEAEAAHGRLEAAARKLSFRRKPGTDIFTVRVSGPDPQKLLAFATALEAEYRANELRVKKAKDTELRNYVAAQIREQEKAIGNLREVLKAHRDVEPLETDRDTADRRGTEVADQIRKEKRARTAARDALLAELMPEHPKVVAAQEVLDAFTKIAEAKSSAELAALAAGPETQWVTLRQEQLDEEARKAAKEAEIERIRAGIGTKFTELLRTGSDPKQVEREYQLAQESYEGLKRRLSQVELSLADVSSDIEILSDPMVQPPGTTTTWVLAVAVALLAGLVAPFLVESLVVALHTVPDLERTTGLRTLAVVPRVEGAGGGGGAASLVAPGTPPSDALRMLRTNVESALDYPARRVILVASAEPGEGKSLVAANLAATYAEMGLPTLLVDLDLRKPSVHEIYRVRRGPGLSDVLSDGTPWRRAVQIPEVDQLHLLPAGSAVEDAGGLLATVKLAELLDEMRQIFSVVVCDSPALLAVADAALVARRADAVLLVYALGTTPSRSLARAQGILSTARANVLGLVANDLAGSDARPGYYYYGRRKGRG